MRGGGTKRRGRRGIRHGDNSLTRRLRIQPGRRMIGVRKAPGRAAQSEQRAGMHMECEDAKRDPTGAACQPRGEATGGGRGATPGPASMRGEPGIIGPRSIARIVPDGAEPPHNPFPCTHAITQSRIERWRGPSWIGAAEPARTSTDGRAGLVSAGTSLTTASSIRSPERPPPSCLRADIAPSPGKKETPPPLSAPPPSNTTAQARMPSRV